MQPVRYALETKQKEAPDVIGQAMKQHKRSTKRTGCGCGQSVRSVHYHGPAHRPLPLAGYAMRVANCDCFFCVCCRAVLAVRKAAKKANVPGRKRKQFCVGVGGCSEINRWLFAGSLNIPCRFDEPFPRSPFFDSQHK